MNSRLVEEVFQKSNLQEPGGTALKSPQTRAVDPKNDRKTKEVSNFKQNTT